MTKTVAADVFGDLDLCLTVTEASSSAFARSVLR
jgi:hypothetical protein